MIENLDFLLNQDQIEMFLNQNAKKIFGEVCGIKILELKRSKTYNPDSYNVLYKIKLGNEIKEIRASATKTLLIDKKTEFKIIQYYYENGFDKGDLLVAKPLAYFDEFNLMFYENIMGSVFINDLNDDLEKLKIKTKDSALALKKIHALKKPDFDLWDSDALFIFKNYEKASLAKYYPELNNKLDNLISNIKEKVDKIKSADYCHGDYQPANIIFSDDKLYIFDFGLTCLLDREYDVATFVNQLRVMIKRFGKYENFEILKNIFLENYGNYNKEKYEIYSLLLNIRILVTFCVTQGKEDNLDYMPLLNDLIMKELSRQNIL